MPLKIANSKELARRRRAVGSLRKAAAKKPETIRVRVYFEQVNASFVDVTVKATAKTTQAEARAAAEAAGRRAWRKIHGEPGVRSIEALDNIPGPFKG